MQHEKLNSMKKQLAQYLRSDALLKNAIKELSSKDMIRGSLIARNAHHSQVQLDAILDEG